MAYDAEFFDGFDKYGPVGGIYNTSGGGPLLGLLLAGEWSSILGYGDTPSLEISIVPALSGPAAGKAIFINNQSAGFGGEMYLSRSLGANYQRMIAGGWVSFPVAFAGFGLFHNGVCQLSVYALPGGQVAINRGNISGGTLLAETTQVRPIGSIFRLEWDLTIAPGTGGSVALWFDGAATSVATGGLNTSADGSSIFNQAGPGGNTGGGIILDHLYEHLFVAGGSGDTPLLSGPMVDTKFASSDVSVAFTPAASVIGTPYVLGGNSPPAENIPGANTLFLRKFTAPVAMTLQSVACQTASTSVTAKFTPVVYADSGGAPGALLWSGPQVVGCVNGTPLVGALTAPELLTAATPYWLGFITDTGVAIYVNVDQPIPTAALAANTYTSGAPNPAPTMTFNELDWAIWGNCTGSAANWPNVGINPAPVPVALGLFGGAAIAFNQSATIGQQDLFGFPNLSGAPTYVYSAAIKVLAAVPEGGTRDINVVMKSGGTTGDGSASAFPLSASFLWQASYFDDDPNTSAAWGANISALNAADGGYNVQS